MSPDKTKELIFTYPPLFSDLDDRSCVKLFGFECGDGWFDLLKESIERIGKICEEDPELQDIRVDQIKEKYGTLRFYLNLETDAMSEIIRKAENNSAITCENCGEPGTGREERRWISVRCDSCWNNCC